MPLSRTLRDRLKQGLHGAFRLGQRMGVDVLPRHFYSAVPDLRALRSSDTWRVASDMPGVAGTDLEAQAAEVDTWFTSTVRDHLERIDVHAEAVRRNGAEGFGPMESQLLYALVATRRPRKVIQVGAGVSTAVILQAAAHHGVDVEIVAVDPFPTPLLTDLDASGDITLIREPAQSVGLATLTDLAPGDLFFVDSTHTVKPGSEVNRMILEVFPRLPDDVLVHVHDIYFPFDYPPDLLSSRIFFWDESTLLHAFLIGNTRASILVSSSMLAHSGAPVLDRSLVGYRPAEFSDGLYVRSLKDRHFPASTYLRTHAPLDR